MMRQRTIFFLGLVSWLALGVACSGTETDNPVSTGPGTITTPDSPADFETPPGAPPCDPGPGADEPPRDLPLWAHDARRLVGWDQGKLVVIDVSEPGTPRVLSKTALAGYPRQVLLDGDAVTLVIAEVPMLDGAPPSAARELDAVMRLIRFDITAPEAPVRVADLALDGEFWQVVPQPGGYWLMGARIDPVSLQCDVPRNMCGFISRDDILLDHVTFAGGAFVRGVHVELPYQGRAVAVPGGFVTASEGALHVAAFDGAGGLLPVRDVPFAEYVQAPFEYTPVAVTPDYVALLSPDLEVIGNDGAVLSTVAAAAVGGTRSRFIGDGVFGANDDPRVAGVFIDLSNPAAPVSTPLDRISAVVPIEPDGGGAATRAVGWYQEGLEGRFSLLSLETSPPTVLDSASASFNLSSYTPERVWADGDRVYFAYRAADNSRLVGAVGTEGDELTVRNAFDVHYADTVLGIGDQDYVNTSSGFSISTASSDAASELELNPGRLLGVAVGDGGEATLLEAPDGARRLEIQRGGAIEVVPVSPQAVRVLAAGERWLVLGAATANAAQPLLTVVGDTPARVLTELELPAAAVPPLGAFSSVNQYWLSVDFDSVPLRISDDRFVLVRELDVSCNSVADCAAFGVTAEPIDPDTVNASSVDCPPSDISMEPCEPMPVAAPTAGNHLLRRAFFVFDARTGALGAPLELDALGDSYWQGDVSIGSESEPQTLFALRLEPVGEQGRGQRKVRFVLERLGVGADGSLAHTGTNVVPGYPMALIDTDTLLSIQPTPEANGDGQLVRSQLAGDGVVIEETRVSDARYGGFAIGDGYAVHLRLSSSNACEPVAVLESVSLDGSLAATGRVELPGEEAEIVGAYGREVIVDVGRRAFTRVHVADDGSLSVEGFTTAPALVYDAEWRDGVLYGSTPGGPYSAGVVRLPL